MSQRNNSNIPASYLILIRQNKILLLRRHNTGYQDGQYSTIAGHVEEGESFSQCIIREAKEEAGITLKSVEERLKVCSIFSNFLSHFRKEGSGTLRLNTTFD
ncbi:MAG: NUDIX domain-containing protein, partial [Campylobacteraceae bacterium]|nr:NUDIX domain-containing protein [Campylobacteraceae bacterium]